MHWTTRIALAATVAVSAPAFAVPPPAPDQLTEFGASSWGGWADGGTSSLENDTGRKVTGSASLRYETTGCFDTLMWAPLAKNAGWNFTAAGSGGLAFWVYAENPNGSFQGPCPWIHLYSNASNYFAFHPTRDFFNDALGQWVYVTVPFNGSAQWTRTQVGSPSLSNVNWIEIHGDTWGCNFTVWLDGLTFAVSYAPPQGLVAVAGNHRVSLSWLPYNDVNADFDHYAIYRQIAEPFNDVSGMTPIATVYGVPNTSYSDESAINGISYYYAVTAVFENGAETTQVQSVGPRTPHSETDLQVTCISRTPRYPRYWPEYSYYWVTEPGGFGPYLFSAATGLGGGQNEQTQRWPAVGDLVSYTATIRNRGTNSWSGTLQGAWFEDGEPLSSGGLIVSLAPGQETQFTLNEDWDGLQHAITFSFTATSDQRPQNNSRTLWTKSAPFLTYVDLTFIENFREYTPYWPNPATDDMLDWLQRHADEMNAMFVAAGSAKRVHYDVLEVLDDHEPDPGLPTIYFGVFPFRYRGGEWGDPRAPGYYHADVDIDYGLCHELSHQLGLVDIYQLDVGADGNQVSSQGYTAVECLMHGCSPLYSAHSGGGMTKWAEIVHGYYGQYMYDIPEQVRIRVLDYYGEPLAGATVKMYQYCERPGQGKVITNQVKAQGVTDAAGVWTLPNVPIDPEMVPPTPAGVLHDNPFGYLAVVGTNGVLHFKVEYDDFVDYCWLDITECNVAFWAGQTEVATFDRPVAIGGDLQLFPPADLAELNAVNWSSWAQDGAITLTDDTVRKHNGAASVKGVFTGGFDNYVRYPSGILAKWDLSGVNTIRFWAWSDNPNFSYQNASPWVRLGNYQHGYFQWTPSYDLLNQAEDHWYEFVIPVAGGGNWSRTTFGDPSLSQINYFELHADTWGYGFQLWLDGVRFEPQPQPATGDLNCDGDVGFGDINPFVDLLTP